MKQCTICGNDLSVTQVKYCSNTCKQSAHYKKFKTDNPNSTYSQFSRADKRKKEFIRQLGGKCSKCGYSKNYGALSFHHKYDKLFPLDSRNIGNRSLESLKLEVAKCDLLCLNCHMELHNPQCLLHDSNV